MTYNFFECPRITLFALRADYTLFQDTKKKSFSLKSFIKFSIFMYGNLANRQLNIYQRTLELFTFEGTVSII